MKRKLLKPLRGKPCRGLCRLSGMVEYMPTFPEVTVEGKPVYSPRVRPYRGKSLGPCFAIATEDSRSGYDEQPKTRNKHTVYLLTHVPTGLSVVRMSVGKYRDIVRAFRSIISSVSCRPEQLCVEDPDKVTACFSQELKDYTHHIRDLNRWKGPEKWEAIPTYEEWQSSRVLDAIKDW